MTVDNYRELQAVDFGDVEISSLTDISKLRIDKEQPTEKRRRQYLEKVGNSAFECLAYDGLSGYRKLPLSYIFGILG